MNLTQEEMINMVYCLGEAQRNTLLAARIYAAHYPNQRHPQKCSFDLLKERFERTGEVKYEKKERKKRVLNEEKKLECILKIVEDPHTSTREISKEIGISQSTVSNVIRKEKFHPYHIQLHQELELEDHGQRLAFCNWAMERTQEQENFFNYVLFTDEATFHKNGCVNRHNFHYYETFNPHILRVGNHQHRWSLNVWAGIIGSYIVGPFFFDGVLNGDIYHGFLNNNLERLMINVPQLIKNQMWFQQDGAPAHFSLRVRGHLNERFNGRWIGRGGPVPWPPRSPDLTKLDFFLWGYIKELVYRETPNTRDDMQNRIIEAFRSITPVMLQDVSRSFRNRVQACIQQNGAHFEHLIS